MFKSAFRAIARKPLESISRDHFVGPGTCLTYHRIAPDDYRPDPFSPNLVLRVCAGEFEKQMKHLSENYECLSIDDLSTRIQEGRLGPRSVAVTFDDGYRDNLELALPILKKYNVPAAIYLTTGLMEGTLGSLWWEANEDIVRRLDRVTIVRRGETLTMDTSNLRAKNIAFSRLHSLFMISTPEEQELISKDLRNQAGIGVPPPDVQALTWDEVIHLDREPLVTIGAHSSMHAVLARLTSEQLNRELSESRAVLEKKLGHKVVHLAYPFGNHSSADHREFRVARECGYRSAVTTRLGHLYPFHAKHPHALPRITVAYGDTFSHFTWKLAGLECLLKRPWSRFRPDGGSE